MDKMRTVALAFLISAGSAFAIPFDINEGIFAVNAQSTFLLQSSIDNCSAVSAAPGCTADNFLPLVIDLSTLPTPYTPGLGETLNITGLGQYCPVWGPGCTESPPYLAGIFSSTNTVLDSSNLNRVTGAVASGLPNVTDPATNTYYGDQSTIIPDDFQILNASGDGTTVVVPTDANYLIIGVLDSFYADNGGDLSVQLILDPDSGVPEPASYAMVLAGLAGLAVFRRMNRIRKLT
jgi:hypothetical protein